ncbi:IclR family transcriptional regulator [Rhodococcus sp. SGAir0479]|uniref:IclR family transcriptional regulator n=1 Tax=Rhodococcus sp. SGAir0479 TaxID=2567884 RepID=UPI0010CCF480|nr:IclR family transcriptional regulator [Rhodococcus sp. SGAir0479]QCQ90235.1 IclR family transcriptional regulator [Rhodococcus sp. SGAir0479]
MEPSSGGTTAAARAAEVLLEFGRGSSGLGVSEIARSTGISKAVTHRILTTFVECGLLLYEPSTRRYLLGPAAATLGARALDVSPLRRAAREALVDLQRTTGETATVTGRLPGGRVYLDQVESTQEIKMTVELGRRFELYSGSSGRIILAHLSEAEQEDVLSRPLSRLTPATMIDPVALRAALQEARARGTCRSTGERQEGAASVAAPVFGADGTVVGSISVCGPSYRMTDEACDEYEGAVVEAAQRVSRVLGYRPTGAPVGESQ